MKQRISSFDIRVLISEIGKEITGAYLDKVQQIGPELFKFSFSSKTGKKDLLIEIGKRFNLTSYSIKAPEKPSQLSIVLRKYLENKKLEKIDQHEFDRVVVMDFGEHSLVLEFFSHGNMLLIDKESKINLNFRSEEWKDRKIKKGEGYRFPNAGLNPYSITLDEFKEIFTEKDAVRGLAKSLSFGGEYAEEICYKAGIDKNKEKLDDEEKERLFSAMRQMLFSKTEPVMQNNQLFPFPLSKSDVQKSYKTMNEAVDEFYLKEQEESQKLKKLRKRLDEQINALQRFEKEILENKEKGDLIYKSYTDIERMLDKKKGKFVAELD